MVLIHFIFDGTFYKIFSFVFHRLLAHHINQCADDKYRQQREAPLYPVAEVLISTGNTNVKLHPSANPASLAPSLAARVAHTVYNGDAGRHKHARRRAGLLVAVEF